MLDSQCEYLFCVKLVTSDLTITCEPYMICSYLCSSICGYICNYICGYMCTYICSYIVCSYICSYLDGSYRTTAFALLFLLAQIHKTRTMKAIRAAPTRSGIPTSDMKVTWITVLLCMYKMQFVSCVNFVMCKFSISNYGVLVILIAKKYGFMKG